MVLLIVYAPNRSQLFYVAMALVCTDTMLVIWSGSRLSLLTPIAVFVFKYLHRFDITVRNFIYIFSFIPLIVYVILPLSSSIEQARGNKTIDVDDIKTSYNQTKYNYVKMLFEKFNSFSGGLTLINRGGGMGSAGLMPYYGSALIFIPRALWPDRPVAGSDDGTIYGHPSRIIPSVQGGSDAYNVDVSPLYISMWQLGFLGIPVFVISGIAFLIFINQLLLSRYFSTKTIGIYLVGIPGFTILYSPDYLIKQVVMVTIILAFFKFIRFLSAN